MTSKGDVSASEERSAGAKSQHRQRFRSSPKRPAAGRSDDASPEPGTTFVAESGKAAASAGGSQTLSSRSTADRPTPEPIVIAVADDEGHQLSALSSSVATDTGTEQLQDLKHNEWELRKLLDDFNSNKLHAFDQKDALLSMKQLREKQENLAYMHFKFFAEEERSGPRTPEERELTRTHLTQLITDLHNISETMAKFDSTAAVSERSVTAPKMNTSL